MEGRLPHVPTVWWVLAIVVAMFALYHFVIRPNAEE